MSSNQDRETGFFDVMNWTGLDREYCDSFSWCATTKNPSSPPTLQQVRETEERFRQQEERIAILKDDLLRVALQRDVLQKKLQEEYKARNQ